MYEEIKKIDWSQYIEKGKTFSVDSVVYSEEFRNSRFVTYKVKDAIVVHSIEELLEELKKYDKENIYIIGGESIYRQMLPYCDVAHVTKIDHAYEADDYFPDLDSDPEWEITADSDEQVYFDITYQFLKYERKKS